MVDCGNPRCAQERRSFRRDLQVWSKKLPLVLGLERIAADYVDNDTAKLLLNPYPAWEQELIQDFEPCRRCFHCDKKLPNIYKRVQRIINDAKKGKENNGKICLRSLQDLMPFCADFYTRSFGQELFSDVVKTYFLTETQQPEVQEESPPMSVPATNEIPAKLRVPHLIAARSSKKQEVGKQGYTEKDLDCAVSDIHSGKLGTRRAALIYGIPRSTLRNKMIKPEQKEKVMSRDENERPSLADFDVLKPACVHHLPRFKMSEIGMFGLSKPVPNRGSATGSYPINIKLDPNDHDFYLEYRLRQIRRMHNLNGPSEVQPRPAHVNHLKLPLLIDVVRKLVHQKFMEVKNDHGRKNSFETKSSDHQTKIFNPFNPYLPTFSSYHTTHHDDENHLAPTYKNFMGDLYISKMNDKHFIPKPFGKVNESSRIGDTLKDIIAKTISEKIRFKDGSSDEGSLPSTPEKHRIFIGKSRDHNLFSFHSEIHRTSRELESSSECCSPPKRPRKGDGRSYCNSGISLTHSGSSSTKKTRPKRGQYRRYNSQLLMDAVKAVQRGEMSVHRAGSYFGVPHSTLEYKVKERHLMRQKKLKETQSSSGSKSTVVLSVTQTTDRDSSLTPEDDVYTSKKHNSSSSARSSNSSTSPPPILSCHPKTQTACPSQSFPLSSSSSSPLPSSALSVPPNKDLSNLVWFQPYMTTVSHHIDQSLGLIPPNLSLNNSASELLRQLQYKVQAKSSSFPADCAFELPCVKEHIFDFTQTSSIKTPMADRLALYNESV